MLPKFDEIGQKFSETSKTALQLLKNDLEKKAIKVELVPSVILDLNIRNLNAFILGNSQHFRILSF